MGRKKISITRINDERNRQVGLIVQKKKIVIQNGIGDALFCGYVNFYIWNVYIKLSTGDIHQKKVWSDEEGIWAECAVWLWDCSDHLHLQQQAVPVRQLWHGQGVAQVHRV